MTGRRGYALGWSSRATGRPEGVPPPGASWYGGGVKVAFGWRAHSGWAALTVVGESEDDSGPVIVERLRVELVEEDWACAPYHASEKLALDEAERMVKRGIDSARRLAIRELRVAARAERERGNDLLACAVLVVDPMPPWSVAEVRSVHFRMHKAEGAMFREALADAAEACGIRLVALHEKKLKAEAMKTLGLADAEVERTIAKLGKAAGRPWAKDQKDTTLAGLVALRVAGRPPRS